MNATIGALNASVLLDFRPTKPIRRNSSWMMPATRLAQSGSWTCSWFLPRSVTPLMWAMISPACWARAGNSALWQRPTAKSVRARRQSSSEFVYSDMLPSVRAPSSRAQSVADAEQRRLSLSAARRLDSPGQLSLRWCSQSHTQTQRSPRPRPGSPWRNPDTTQDQSLARENPRCERNQLLRQSGSQTAAWVLRPVPPSSGPMDISLPKGSPGKDSPETTSRLTGQSLRQDHPTRSKTLNPSGSSEMRRSSPWWIPRRPKNLDRRSRILT